jgi:hypothetical protein
MPATVVLYVRIPPALNAELRDRAAEHGVTVAAFATRAIEWYLQDKFDWTPERSPLP